jgi:HTH-type transcriptional regulator / antitoxin HigA
VLKEPIISQPIKNNQQYEAALERTYELMQYDLKINSPECNDLEILSILVSEYESTKYPVPKPDPI